jgi:hypothetical protein
MNIRMTYSKTGAPGLVEPSVRLSRAGLYAYIFFACGKKG